MNDTPAGSPGTPDRMPESPGSVSPPFVSPLRAMDFCALVLVVVAVEVAGGSEMRRLQIAPGSVEAIKATMVVRAAQIVAMLLPLRLVRGHGPSALGLRGGDVRGGLAWAAAAGAALAGGFAVAAAGWYLATGGNLVREALGRSPLAAAATPGTAAAILAAMGLVGPVAEELFFRGALYGVLRRSFSVPQAVLVTSLFFAALHDGGAALPVIPFTGGVVFALLFEKTGSLLAPVLVHGAGNMALLLLPRGAA